MLTRVIECSVRNRLLVLLLTWRRSSAASAPFANAAGGAPRSVRRAGDRADRLHEQAPRIVEDQVTYPIAAEMLKVPGARTVRGLLVLRRLLRLRDLRGRHRSLLGALAGARVPERAQGKLPAGVRPSSAPTRPASAGCTSTRSRTRPGALDLAELRASGLVSPLRAHRGARRRRGRERRRVREAVPGRLDPAPAARLRDLRQARDERHPSANNDVGAMVMESPGASTWCAGSGYLEALADIENVVVGATAAARRSASPRSARYVGPGDPARDRGARRPGRGGRRHRRDARRRERAATIERVKAKLAEIAAGLPPGVRGACRSTTAATSSPRDRDARATS